MMLLLLLACKPEPAPSPTATGDGLFLQGCPEAGRATARALGDIAEQPWGPDALAMPGDVVLLNERAAFVIQAPEDPRTYYHYGGIPVDAVAVEGCEQAGPEILGELGFVIGQLDLGEFEQSGMHMFRGESLEIVADGSDGGAAVVEVTGTDDRFWLVELTLVRRVYEEGGRKLLDELYGLDVTVRYTLEPGDPTLRIDVLLGGEPITDGFLVGAVLFPSDHTTSHGWASGEIEVGGFGLDVGVPWVGSASPTGSTAVAMPQALMARTVVAGVTAILDINQAFEPLSIGGETRFLLAVGPTDAASAAAGLEAQLGGEWQDLEGTVRDDAAVAGATVEVLAEDDEGDWTLLTELVTGDDGRFAGRVPAGDLRLRATGAGRDDGEASDPGDLVLGAAGSLTVEATDDDGASLPVRVELERDDGLVVVGFPTPQDPEIAAPPGHYTAWVSRGYEYAITTTELDVPGTLAVTLERVLDTEGWASFDSHVHAGPSADSEVLAVDRMRTAAAAGLDVVVSTDHEAIVDLAPAIAEAGLGDWLGYALGSEITATVPEHTNAWPFPVVEDLRGDPIRWYELGLGDIYAAERDRGATVVQLNHARVNGECGILCVLDWDRMGDPVTADPEALGLPAGTEAWSWDFDSFEVMNGLRSPYLDASDPRHTGALVDWLAFHNHGHRVTGVAVTDEHDLVTPGAPRTWTKVEDDSLPLATELAAGVLAGAAQFSAGAFARVEVAGAGPGETVSVDGEADVWLHVEALPEVDVTRVDVLVDCDIAMTLEATDPGGVVKLDETFTLGFTADAYVVVIAMGEGAMPRGLADYDALSVPRGVVNPIFVDADGDGQWTAPGGKSCDWEP